MNTIALMSASAYHSDPAPGPSLSSSLATVLLFQSPRHAWRMHPKLNPRYEPEESARFDLGSAAHALLLEGNNQMEPLAFPDYRTKAAQAARDEARARGKFPVLDHQYMDVRKMVEVATAFIATTELADIWEEGAAEQTCIWQEEYGGKPIYLRSRLDWISKDRRFVIDYKTVDSAEPNTFGRQIQRMAYDVQHGFYCRAVQECAQVSPELIFVAQEISPPYCCSLVSLSNAYKEVGARKVERAIELWGKCITTDDWPAYPTQIHWMEPSAWQIAEVESTL
jgi:PDDEXK-like domain of unknown function (DUF3799)